MNWLKQIIGMGAVSGAAHHATKPTFFFQIYEQASDWVVSWYTEDHSKGEVLGPFNFESDARAALANWKQRQAGCILVEVR